MNFMTASLPSEDDTHMTFIGAMKDLRNCHIFVTIEPRDSNILALLRQRKLYIGTLAALVGQMENGNAKN